MRLRNIPGAREEIAADRYVIPEDVKEMSRSVLRHRIGLTYAAYADGVTADDLIDKYLYKWYVVAIMLIVVGAAFILIENYKGAFPFWLSPLQVGVVPIREEHNDYAAEVMELMRRKGIRAEGDLSDKNMKVKIKTFKNYKDPYIIVLGDKEKEERTVSINLRGSNRQIQNVPLDKFLAVCEKMNEEHCNELIDTIV